MVRTAQPIINPEGPFPGTVAPLALDFIFTAADSVNMDDFIFTGRELILINNTTGGALTITLTSAPDPQGRSADIVAYSVGAGLFSMFWAGSKIGWDQVGGKFFLEASAVGVEFAIVRIPAAS